MKKIFNFSYHFIISLKICLYIYIIFLTFTQIYFNNNQMQEPKSLSFSQDDRSKLFPDFIDVAGTRNPMFYEQQSSRFQAQEIKKHEMMVINDTIEICRENYLFYIYLNQNQALINLVIIQEDSDKTRKYVKSLNFGQDMQRYLHLNCSQDYKNFFRKQSNYKINTQDGSISIFWKIIAEDYKKDISSKLQLKEKMLTRVEKLEYEVIFLKKKMKMSRNVNYNQKRIEFINNNQIKVEELSSQNVQHEAQRSKKMVTLQQPSQMTKNVKNKTKRKMISKDRKQKSNSIDSAKIYKMKRTYRKKCQAKNETHLLKLQTVDENIEITKQTNLSFTPIKPSQSQLSVIQIVPESFFKSNRILKSVQVGDRIRISYQNGDYYFGSLLQSVYHGKGKYFTKDINQICEGIWDHGQIKGMAKIYDGTDSRLLYQGEVKNFLRHGFGTEYFQNGEKYTGNFKQNYRQGQGTYHYINGDIYTGEWDKDLCHGKGIERYKNGTYFEGYWVNDEKNGTGTLKGKKHTFEQIWENGRLIQERIVKQKQYTHVRFEEQD